MYSQMEEVFEVTYEYNKISCEDFLIVILFAKIWGIFRHNIIRHRKTLE